MANLNAVPFAEERKIGSLGIFPWKKTADSVGDAECGGLNILMPAEQCRSSQTE